MRFAYTLPANLNRVCAIVFCIIVFHEDRFFGQHFIHLHNSDIRNTVSTCTLRNGSVSIKYALPFLVYFIVRQDLRVGYIVYPFKSVSIKVAPDSVMGLTMMAMSAL